MNDLSFHMDDGKIFVFLDGDQASERYLNSIVEVLNTDVMKRIVIKSLDERPDGEEGKS